MANDMEFTISAKDQASKAVETVQKKLKSFGSDLAKMALGFAAPLALAQAAFSAIGDAIEEHKKKVQEAIDNTAELSNKAADLGLSVDEYQRLSSAADKAGMSIDKVAKAYTEVQKLLASATGDGNSTAKMLESLGFAADDIAKGLVKPMDVIEKLGATMLGAKDDTTAMRIATAVLGETLAKDLLPQLKAAMDLAAGFQEDPGISAEEADLIKQEKLLEKQKKNKEEAKLAREAAAKRFLETDPEATKLGVQLGQIRAGFENTPDAKVSMRSKAGFLSEDPKVQEAILKILKERNAAEKERQKLLNQARAQAVLDAAAQVEAQKAAEKAAEEAKKAAEKDADKKKTDEQKAADKAKADAEKAAEKAAKDAEKEKEDKAKKEKDDLAKALDAEEKASKSATMTVSSLREIGGGLAGEALVTPTDLAQKTLDIQQKILLELQNINTKTLPQVPASTDFTKTA